MLTEQECLPIVQSVMALSGNWLQRGPVDFYTLGAATYLDGAWDREPYQSHRSEANPILSNCFSGLYSLLLNSLSGVLGSNVSFLPELALPGFHVFAAKPGKSLLPGTKAFAASGGAIHLDLQYEYHATLWERYEEVDIQQPLSFTLPLQLPKAGGGLNIWPRHEQRDDPSYRQPNHITYQCGELVWFTGPLLHQISPLRQVSAQDRRITLQGHGLRCDGRWLLYF